ncbi:uncharacterized protein F4822DRAFT_65558 [Hypoxylon trugodes]|uniref:uncharacterized protein n=1 Tax=Hypoxylon trugodes TaxID=326681 RepID=UPI00219E155F|nr:uncharacterized protein F4822DRAFT_65558 [Hypoxylon trugodes]KAI1384298.1 hypothetical protein F4822DRAFT_65558 [Hypoxylon trugodes]
MPETLREKATKKIQGPGANPSQLGDPISVKAEQSDNVPTEGEKGAGTSHGNNEVRNKNDNTKKGNNDDESLREKAAKKLHGPEANPSQLGDPISLKAETSDNIPAEREEGAHNKKDSKL